MTPYKLLEDWSKACPNDKFLGFESDQEIYSVAQTHAAVCKLANYLFELGVRPGQTVAFAVPRSSYQIIIQLAVSALGCTFVPIDAEKNFFDSRNEHITAALTKAPVDCIIIYENLLAKEQLLLANHLKNIIIINDSKVVKVIDAQSEHLLPEIKQGYKEFLNKVVNYSNYLIANKLKACQTLVLITDDYTERSLWRLAANMAGAYIVCIFPTDKLLIEKIKETKPEILLANKQDIESVPPEFEHDYHFIDLASIDIDHRLAAADTELDHAAKMQPAYFIFSSGSTGKPKGMAIPDGAMRDWIPEITKLFVHMDAHKDNNILTHTSVAFDPAIWDLLVALTKRSRLTVAGADAKLSRESFIELLHTARITDLLLVPSESASLGIKPKLETLIANGLRSIQSTGEAFDKELLTICLNKIVLINLFGSTECGFGVSGLILTESNTINEIGIGLMPECVDYLLLDEGEDGSFFVGKDIEEGVLAVSKTYMAKGYLDEVTNRRNNFIHINGKDYYLEGVRLRKAENCFYYVGSIGRDVFKLNGRKINVAEAERKLKEIKGIKNVALIIPESLNSFGKQRIAAIIELNADGSRLPLHYIRNYLHKAKIEAGAIPSFVYYTNKPLPIKQLSGKLDRKALSKIHHLEMDSGDMASPTNKLEKEMQQIWYEFLFAEDSEYQSCSDLSCVKPFSVLGAKSIQKVGLLNYINDKFKVEVELHEFSEQELTIRNCTRIVASNMLATKREFGNKGLPLLIVPLKLREHNPEFTPIDKKATPIFLLSGITGDGFSQFSTLASKIDSKGSPLYFLLDPGYAYGDTASMSINELAAMYIRAMRKIQPIGKLSIIAWSFGCSVLFEIAKQQEKVKTPLQLATMLDGECPISPIFLSCDQSISRRQLAHRLYTLCHKLNKLYEGKIKLELPKKDFTILEQTELQEIVDFYFAHLKFADEKAELIGKIIYRNLIGQCDYALEVSQEIATKNKDQILLKNTELVVLTCAITLSDLLKEYRELLQQEEDTEAFSKGITTLWWEKFCRSVKHENVAGDHFNIITSSETAQRISNYIIYSLNKNGININKEELREFIKSQVSSEVQKTLLLLFGNHTSGDKPFLNTEGNVRVDKDKQSLKRSSSFTL